MGLRSLEGGLEESLKDIDLSVPTVLLLLDISGVDLQEAVTDLARPGVHNIDLYDTYMIVYCLYIRCILIHKSYIKYSYTTYIHVLTS